MIKIKKGLDLPISGAPKQSISEGKAATTVAVIGPDYPGLKPTMQVQVGDQVKLGQVLFFDKKNMDVAYTAPAGGVVKEINRGAKRSFQSIVIEVAQSEEAQTYTSYVTADLASLSGEAVTKQLLESGLWTALRARPYNKVAVPGNKPNSVFITAMDTNPLCADPSVVIGQNADAFEAGQTVVSRLTEGKTYLCIKEGSSIAASANITKESFGGVHPAGNAGTHIHFLDPVSANKEVWSVGYQDVIAIGKLFLEGKLDTSRVVALGGPQVKEPRLVTTRVGANLDELLADQVNDGENRIISGSVFGGRTAAGMHAWLGRYDNQVSVLAEDRSRPMFHYLRAGFNMHSVKNIYISKLFGKKSFDMTTTTNGSERAMMPIGAFEKIMPLDILPTQLLRAIVVGDLDMAEKLGALELAEEDLSLCTYVCAGKYEYGAILRDNLTRIEKEG